MQSGREITLPEGVTAKQVDAVFAKFRSRESLTAAEQAVMQKLRETGAFGGMGGGRGGMGGGGFGGSGGFGNRPRGGSDYQFGGNYIVFVSRGGEIVPVHVRTGLTDLDYSEVVSGLKATDSVIILPSASLVQSQQEFRQRIGSFANQGVPGMRQATTTPTAPAAAAARPQGGGAPR